jgi:hypothetical protein
VIALPLTRGQRLWFVPDSCWVGLECYVTVARLGSRWAYLDSYDGMRAEIATGELELPGKLYASKADYARETSVRKAWGHLRDQVCRFSMFGRMPQGLTYADIVKARQLLKLEAP